MDTVFCPECNEKVRTAIVSKKESFPVKDEDVAVDSLVRICTKCQNEMFDEELDEANLTVAYNEYRTRHRLLSPAKIREIREKYGLSQRALSRLLNWGEITINRYESGGIQDAVHNEVLEFIDEPRNMQSLFKKNQHLLPNRMRGELKQHIDALMVQESQQRISIDFEDLFSRRPVDEFSGYKRFDWDKMNQMIIYLADALEGVYKTAINKFLWYMDFLCFKETSVSISGSPYIHLPYGPVPDDYEFILGSMSKTLEIKEIEFDNDIVGEKYFTKVSPNNTVFLKAEIEVMNYVIGRFESFTTTQLSKYSHRERAYLATKEGEKISYELARELSLSLPRS